MNALKARRKEKSEYVKNNLFTLEILFSQDPEIVLCQRYHREWILRARAQDGLPNLCYDGTVVYGFSQEIKDTIVRHNGFLNLYPFALLHGQRMNPLCFQRMISKL